MYRFWNCFLVILVGSGVICEDCVTVDFENGFEELFNDYGVCTGLSTWNVDKYSSVNMISPHPKSTSFITAQAGVSCVSSFKFMMTAGGTLEVNLHTTPAAPFDQLTVIVFQSVVGGNDVLIGTAVHISDPVHIWETINMTIDGIGRFEGYVTFQTLILSINTIIRIDSFRYIGPSYEKDLCVIYEEDQTTTITPTTIATSTIAPASTTTEGPNKGCVTENFEYNFEENFTNKYGVCVELSAWNVKQYSSVDIDSPHPKSTTFITPQPSNTSCVSSFNFTMTAGGTLEVNVYTMPVSTFDQLTVRVFQSIVGGDDISINSFFHNSNSEPIWETISMTINGYGSFKGYVTFQAWTLSSNPIILIDSFRYIDPYFDKDSCDIYKEEELTTVKPTTTTEAPEEDCVTVNFEYNAKDDLTNDYGVCVGLPIWNVKQYSSVDINSPHAKSTTFISPHTGISCVSSLKFVMTAGGTLEVNVYTMPVTPFDQMTVRVFQSIDGQNDVLISEAFHSPNSVRNWETISMIINGYSSFEGYITFQTWTASTNPIILIDSFRYIAPSFDKDLCVIYKEDQNTTVPTSTTEAITTTKAPNEDCVTVDFESNFEDDFNNNEVCDGLSEWDIRKYSSVNIDSPHPGSASFIAPRSGLTCISSFNFTMTAGGTLEVNVYTMAMSQIDQLTVTVFQPVVGGNDRIFLNNVSSDLVPGWHKLSMTIGGPGRFEGYVTFHTISMLPDPIIWIDSFRYVGPSLDKDSCVIYKDQITSTTIIPTTTTATPTTTVTEATITNTPYEDCETVDFESNFENDFNNYGECAELSAWDVRQYSSVNIGSPHPRSASFIEPRLGFSCVSSFKFPMSAGGTLEVNVFMSSISLIDQLTVTVFQSIAGGDDVTIGRIFRYYWSPEFVQGWQTLNMTVDGPFTFNGYVTFHAINISPSAIILIDSFRYIGPSSDKDSCVIYKDETTATLSSPASERPDLDD